MTVMTKKLQMIYNALKQLTDIIEHATPSWLNDFKKVSGHNVFNLVFETLVARPNGCCQYCPNMKFTNNQAHNDASLNIYYEVLYANLKCITVGIFLFYFFILFF